MWIAVTGDDGDHVFQHGGTETNGDARRVSNYVDQRPVASPAVGRRAVSRGSLTEERDLSWSSSRSSVRDPLDTTRAKRGATAPPCVSVFSVSSMKRLLTVKLPVNYALWECGNPLFGFPHFHTPVSSGRSCTSHDVCMGPWAEPGGLLFALWCRGIAHGGAACNTRGASQSP